MSPRRCGWLALALCGGALAWPGPEHGPAWLAVSAVFWAMAFVFPSDLRRHPAAEPWAIWSLWAGVCALLSGEPWLAFSAAWLPATCALILVLLNSWFVGAHRRAWLAGLGTAAIFASMWWWTAASDSNRMLEASGLLAALCAGVIGIFSGKLPEGRFWRWVSPLAAAAAALLLCRRASWGAILGVAFASACCALSSRRAAPAAAFALAAAALGLHAAELRAWCPWSFWGSAWRIAAAHPLTGIGPGLFARGWVRHAAVLSAPAAPAGLSPAGAAALSAPASAVSFYGQVQARAGSEPLQVLAETGWIGLCLFAIAVARSFPRGFRRLGIEERAAAAVFWALLAEACVDDLLAMPGIRLALFTALAVAAPAWRVSEASVLPHPAESRVLWRMPRPAAALGLAACIAAWVPREAFRRWAGAGLLERALMVAPLEAPLHDMLAKEALFAEPARVGEAMRRVRMAIRADPRNAVYLGQQADLYSAVDDWDAAQASAERAVSIEPNFVEARLLLTQCSLRRGAVAAAEAELSRAESVISKGLKPAGAYEEQLLRWDSARLERLKKAVEISRKKAHAS